MVKAALKVWTLMRNNPRLWGLVIDNNVHLHGIGKGHRYIGKGHWY